MENEDHTYITCLRCMFVHLRLRDSGGRVRRRDRIPQRKAGEKMKYKQNAKMLIYAIACVSLAIISCGTTTTLPQITKSDAIPQYIGNTYAEISSGQEMTVTAEKLNIRTSPGGEVIHFAYLLEGDIVTVYERQTANGYEWCRTGLHWVGCEWLEEIR